MLKIRLRTLLALLAAGLGQWLGVSATGQAQVTPTTTPTATTPTVTAPTVRTPNVRTPTVAVPSSRTPAAATPATITPPSHIQIAELRRQLEAGLRARRTREFRFIARVCQLVENERLTEQMVKGTMQWSRRKHTRIPFPYFERAMRERARPMGVRL